MLLFTIALMSQKIDSSVLEKLHEEKQWLEGEVAQLKEATQRIVQSAEEERRYYSIPYFIFFCFRSVLFAADTSGRRRRGDRRCSRSWRRNGAR
jgi:hypothetical protein